MPIRKHEYYEGAALHILARGGLITRLRPRPPFIELNSNVLVLLKYSTKGRSPWGFSFTADEQDAVLSCPDTHRLFMGLVCGSDGVVALDSPSYRIIASQRTPTVWISCYRSHGEHYEISGPTGTLDKRIAPSAWSKILHEDSDQCNMSIRSLHFWLSKLGISRKSQISKKPQPKSPKNG